MNKGKNIDDIANKRIRKLNKAEKIVVIVYLFTIPWTWGTLFMMDFNLLNAADLLTEETLRGYEFIIKIFLNTMVLNMLLGFPALILTTGKLTRWKGFPGAERPREMSHSESKDKKLPE